MTEGKNDLYKGEFDKIIFTFNIKFRCKSKSQRKRNDILLLERLVNPEKIKKFYKKIAIKRP